MILLSVSMVTYYPASLLFLTYLVSYQCLYPSLKCWCSSGINARPHFLWSFRPIGLLDHSWMVHQYFKFSIFVSSHPNVSPYCYHRWMLISLIARGRNLGVVMDSYFFLALPFPFPISRLVLVILPPKYLHSIPFSSAPAIMQVYLLPRLFILILTIFLFLGLFPLDLFFIL